MQFNLSYHHNWWYNCGSRIPLSRQANIHFYNNYISTDSTGYDGISYVHSIRANAYIFSEANYYFGCKAIADKGGKAWNNTYLGCFGSIELVDVYKSDEGFSRSCQRSHGTS